MRIKTILGTNIHTNFTFQAYINTTAIFHKCTKITKYFIQSLTLCSLSFKYHTHLRMIETEMVTDKITNEMLEHQRVLRSTWTVSTILPIKLVLILDASFII